MTDVSPDELAELLDDFESFCSLIKISTKDGPPKYFSPEGWHDEQREFCLRRTGRDLVLKPRQIGFSTLELARDLQFALTHPGTQTVIVAQESQLANALFLQLRTMWQSLRDQGFPISTKYDNTRELFFAELGSAVRVVEAGGSEDAARKKGRSGTIHRLHATEVAFWSYPAEAMGGLLNAVPTTGEVVIESTPKGAYGLFYSLCQAAQRGSARYKFHFFPWYQHRAYRTTPRPDFRPEPRDAVEQTLRDAGCDDEQIQWWRDQVDDPAKGLDTAEEEFPRDPESCFKSSGRPYIERQHVEWMRGMVREPISRRSFAGRDVAIYAYPEGGREYIAAADVSGGQEGDSSAIVVLEREACEAVAYFAAADIAPGDLGVLLGDLAAFYNRALAAPERNNHGHACLDALTHRALGGSGYPRDRIYVHSDRQDGWPTNQATRPVMLDDMRTAINEHSIISRCAELASEASTLVWDDDGQPRAANKGRADGCSDDGIFALAIALQVRKLDGRSSRVTHGHIRGI